MNAIEFAVHNLLSANLPKSILAELKFAEQKLAESKFVEKKFVEKKCAEKKFVGKKFVELNFPSGILSSLKLLSESFGISLPCRYLSGNAEIEISGEDRFRGDYEINA